MSAAKHTPGPWAIDDHQAGDCYAYVIPESGSILGAICRVDLPLDSYGQGLADARLMAAAPDLLAVLQELQESAAYWSEYDVPLGIVSRINNAIEKAIGSKP